MVIHEQLYIYFFKLSIKIGPALAGPAPPVAPPDNVSGSTMVVSLTRPYHKNAYRCGVPAYSLKIASVVLATRMIMVSKPIKLLTKLRYS